MLNVWLVDYFVGFSSSANGKDWKTTKPAITKFKITWISVCLLSVPKEEKRRTKGKKKAVVLWRIGGLYKLCTSKLTHLVLRWTHASKYVDNRNKALLGKCYKSLQIYHRTQVRLVFLFLIHEEWSIQIFKGHLQQVSYMLVSKGSYQHAELATRSSRVNYT